MAIAQKLALIMGEVDRIPKNGRNEFHKYDYATEADLVEAIRGSMSKHGVAFFPTVKAWDQKGDITSAEVEFHFIDGEDQSELVSTFWGFGQDKGDKGAYKAYTGAVKYCLMKTFLVPTGESDDPEHDGKTPPKPTERKPAENKPAPTKPATTRSAPTPSPAATVETLKSIDEEHRQRKGGWSAVARVLVEKGLPSTFGNLPDDQKKVEYDKALRKLTNAEAEALLMALRTLDLKPAPTGD